MSAHLIALIERPVNGPHWSNTEYGPTFRRLLTKYEGEMIAASALELLEGQPLDESMAAIFRFPNTDAARGFWNDPEYRAVVHLRQALGTFQIFLVPGLDEAPFTVPADQPTQLS